MDVIWIWQINSEMSTFTSWQGLPECIVNGGLCEVKYCNLWFRFSPPKDTSLQAASEVGHSFYQPNLSCFLTKWPSVQQRFSVWCDGGPSTCFYSSKPRDAGLSRLLLACIVLNEKLHTFVMTHGWKALCLGDIHQQTGGVKYIHLYLKCSTFTKSSSGVNGVLHHLFSVVQDVTSG